MPVPDNHSFVPHSQQSCLCVSPRLNIRLCGLLTAPHPLSASPYLFAWSSFILPDRGSIIRVLDWQQPLQIFPPVQLLQPQMTRDDFLTHNKGGPNSLARRGSISPFLGRFICFFISRYSMTSTKVTLVYTLLAYSACILSHTRANSWPVFKVLLLVPCYESNLHFKRILLLLSHKRRSLSAEFTAHNFVCLFWYDPSMLRVPPILLPLFYRIDTF
jgi:hypothetical protein